MNQIESIMNQLRLHGMGRNWKALTETRRSHELSFSEGLELLLQAEIDERKNRPRTVRQSLFKGIGQWGVFIHVC